ncbi:unnamed protein product [Arctia plantaginis]|uniref:Uncharacterized protein n=1 Tax=Arctia plantaginis TaxID=874455 RepID=A0A8S1BN09_ARCPL|nr:unnamed protein product [Arctia plantaginis]
MTAKCTGLTTMSLNQHLVQGPKDPRTYPHMGEGNWGKRDLSCEREGDRLRHSPVSLDHDRDRDRRDGRKSEDAQLIEAEAASHRGIATEVGSWIDWIDFARDQGAAIEIT